MLRIIPKQQQYLCFIRTISASATPAKRFLQTAQLANNEVSYVPYGQQAQTVSSSTNHSTHNEAQNAWERHSIGTRSFKDILKKNNNNNNQQQTKNATQEGETQAQTIKIQQTQSIQQEATEIKPKKRVRRTLKPRKALIKLSATAIDHLKALLNQPDPKLIRIGVRNRGCSGLTYNLEYISEPNKFDEIVEQDGVKVVIDSKALFSIVGSEMDWLDDKISSRFIFKNPNSKGTCGCGESFMV